VNIFRHFLRIVFRKKLVVLVDFDGETNLRLKRHNHLGQPYAVRMGLGICLVLLKPDGSTQGPASFVKRWCDYPVPADAAKSEISELERLAKL
jgi:hypothetical protein